MKNPRWNRYTIDMLAFKYRFHGHGSLRYVYMHGKAVRSHLVTVKYTFHPKREDPRVSVVVSKKVIKGAVGRNRIRRRLYEIVRQEIPKLKHNVDMAIIVFSAEVKDLSADDLAKSIQQVLHEADIYKSWPKDGKLMEENYHLLWSGVTKHREYLWTAHRSAAI